MRRYTYYGLAGKRTEGLSLYNRIIESMLYLISFQTLSRATQRVRLEPEAVRVEKK